MFHTTKNEFASTRAALAAALALVVAGCSDHSSDGAGGSGGAAVSAGGGGAATAVGTGGSSGTLAGNGGAVSPPSAGGTKSGTGGVPVAIGGTPGGSGTSGTGAGGMVASGGASPAGGSGGANSAGAPGQDGGGPSGACDRACLLGVVQVYLDALAARAPMKVPVASTVKYTDNGVTAQLGDGLWKTASELVAGERLDFADPVAGQVASQLVVNENGTTPVIYQVRLKVVAHQITEIESMTVRQTGAANGFFSPMNMKPQPVFLQTIDPAKRLTREQLKAEVDHYVQYLDGKTNASGVHFDAMCDRFENGVETATGLASFQAQSWSFNVTARYLVFDEEMGMVWGMFPFAPGASSLVVGECFKVIDSKIMMIQAVMATIPTTAWN